MEIIKNNFAKTEQPRIYEVVCQNCQSELRVAHGDLNMYGGCACPCCGEYIKAEVIQQYKKRIIPPTYPKSFYDFSNAVEISDDAINDLINHVIKYLREDLDSEYESISSGNTVVTAYRNEDGIIVRVSKGYFEAECDINGNVINDDTD